MVKNGDVAMKGTISILGAIAFSILLLGCGEGENESSTPIPPEEILKYSKYENLYDFDGFEGAGPVTLLAIDKNKNLYGTTRGGGHYYSPTDGGGHGVIFRCNESNNSLNTYLLDYYGNGQEGRDPMGQIAIDDNGTVYGTTFSGGEGSEDTDGGAGVLYSWSITTETPDYGEYKVLYRFKNDGTDARKTTNGVVLHKGVLYGAANNKIFSYDLSPDRPDAERYSILFAFENEEEHGKTPSGGFYFDDQDNIYGLTYEAG